MCVLVKHLQMYDASVLSKSCVLHDVRLLFGISDTSEANRERENLTHESLSCSSHTTSYPITRLLSHNQLGPKHKWPRSVHQWTSFGSTRSTQDFASFFTRHIWFRSYFCWSSYNDRRSTITAGIFRLVRTWSDDYRIPRNGSYWRRWAWAWWAYWSMRWYWWLSIWPRPTESIFRKSCRILVSSGHVHSAYRPYAHVIHSMCYMSTSALERLFALERTVNMINFSSGKFLFARWLFALQNCPRRTVQYFEFWYRGWEFMWVFCVLFLVIYIFSASHCCLSFQTRIH